MNCEKHGHPIVYSGETDKCAECLGLTKLVVDDIMYRSIENY